MARLQDIAQQTGVSKATVSRALRGLPGVSQALRQQILDVAKRSHYVPPRNSTRSASEEIVVCIPDAVQYGLRNPFFHEVLRGILFSLNSRMRLCILDTSLAFSPPIRDRIHIVISPDDVVHGEFVRGQTVLVDSISDDYPFVTMDNNAAGRMATQYLIALGHQDIAFIGKRDTQTSRMRVQGYRQALQMIGASPMEIETEGFSAEDGARAIKSLVGRVSAVVAFNDLMAVGALRALMELGVRVPDQLSIVGFDDQDLTRYTHPTITTIHQPAFEAGVAACALAARLLDGENVSVESSVWLTGSLVVRESCARPAQILVHQ